MGEIEGDREGERDRERGRERERKRECYWCVIVLVPVSIKAQSEPYENRCHCLFLIP